MVTYELVREQFDYCAETGILLRRGVGLEAGWLGQNGYRYVSVGNRKYLVHRIAWLWTYGEWPKATLDHINRNSLDNRLCNLRDVDMTAQGHNQKVRKDNTSGHKNVYFHKPSRLWVVLIFHRRKQICVGYFKDLEQAVAARNTAKDALLNGEPGYSSVSRQTSAAV